MLMKVIVDRFEGKHAMVELAEGVFINMPRTLLSNLVEERDVIIIEIDEEETEQRQNRMEEMMGHLQED